MTNLIFGRITTNEATGYYTTIDWMQLSNLCELTMYSTFPGSNDPMDKPSVSYSPQIQVSREKTFDEVMEEVLEDRAEAWDRLADL